MSRKQARWPAGTCSRCAYFGLSTPATTNLSGNPRNGPLYCQACADYIRENWPSIFPGAGPRQSRRDNPPQQEAT